MVISREFVEERAAASRNVQEQIAADWVWDELNVAGWDAKLAALDAQTKLETRLSAANDGARGVLDAKISQLETWKVQGIGMGKLRFRKDPANLALIEGVEELGAGRRATIDEATAWIEAWKTIDAAWAPTVENTLAAFTVLRDECETLLKTYKRANTAWRRAAEDWNVQIAELDDLCVTWYGAATRVFKEGTAQGDLIRGQVPTTYVAATGNNAGNASPPPPPNPS